MRLPPSASFRKIPDWAWCAAVFALAFWVYWPAVHGVFLWDDLGHITRPELRSFSGLSRIWFDLRATQQYYPVLHSAFWLELQLWGDTPFPYHVWNIVLHATDCCLLVAVLRRLAPTASAEESDEFSGWEWCGALLLAVHPVCVESVAWISEQKNTLSLLFYLASALYFLEFRRSGGWIQYAVASGLFLLALGTKTVTATLPAALLVIFWWQSGRLRWPREIRPLLPWFAVALASGLFTAWVERTIIGADGARFSLDLIQRLLLAGRVVWFYAGNTMLPVNLAFFYDRWALVAAQWEAWTGLVAALLATAGLVWWARRWRGPLAAWLLFVGSLFPALGFFNVYPFLFSYAADHFQYLACVCALGALGLALTRVSEVLSPRLQLVALLTVAGVAGALAWGARQQSGLYVSNEVLFKATVARTPSSWMAHCLLGGAYANVAGRPADALAEYRKAVQLNPDSPDAHMGFANEVDKLPGGRAEAVAHYQKAIELRPNFAEAHNNLGLILARDPATSAEALAHFEIAVRARPQVAEAHLNLADALMKIPARRAEALREYEEAVRLAPGNAGAHVQLGKALALIANRADEAMAQADTALRIKPDLAEAHFLKGNLLSRAPESAAEAAGEYEEALRLKPDMAEVHFNLANLLAFMPNRQPEAIRHYQAVLAVHPEFADAHANLANLLAQNDQTVVDALQHYRAALQIDPRSAWVHLNLAMLLARIQGKDAEAVAEAQEAVRLQPDYVDALNGLAIIYARQGRTAEARRCWQQALQIDPQYEQARTNLKVLDEMPARH